MISGNTMPCFNRVPPLSSTDVLSIESTSFCPVVTENTVMRTSDPSMRTHIAPQQPCALMTAKTSIRSYSTVLPQHLQVVRLIVDSSLHRHAAFVPNSTFRFSAERAIQYVEASDRGGHGVQCQTSVNCQGLIQEVVCLSEKESKGQGLAVPSIPPVRTFTTKTELLGMYEALAAFFRACRAANLEEQLQRKCRIVVENDNAAAVAEAASAVSMVKPECPVHEALQSLLCSNSIPIEFRYLPRGSREGRLADAMSRWQPAALQVEPDALAAAVESALMSLSGNPGHRLWPPDIDVFGSERSHLQQCSYYAYMWDRQCSAANTWDLDWSKWPQEALRGQLQLFGLQKPGVRDDKAECLGDHCQIRKPVCYVFPHPNNALQAVCKIARDKPTAWLVLKEAMKPSERAQLFKLPIKLTVTILPVASRDTVLCPTIQQCSASDVDPGSSPLALHFISWE